MLCIPKDAEHSRCFVPHQAHVAMPQGEVLRSMCPTSPAPLVRRDRRPPTSLSLAQDFLRRVRGHPSRDRARMGIGIGATQDIHDSFS